MNENIRNAAVEITNCSQADYQTAIDELKQLQENGIPIDQAKQMIIKKHDERRSKNTDSINLYTVPPQYKELLINPR